MSKHRAGRHAVAVPAAAGVESFRVRNSVPTMEPYAAPIVAEVAPIVTFDAIPVPAAPVQYVNTFAGRAAAKSKNSHNAEKAANTRHAKDTATPTNTSVSPQFVRAALLGILLVVAIAAAAYLYL